MAIIIDKRDISKDPDAGNRKKLIERCKDGLRKYVHDHIDNNKIKDIAKKDNHRVSSGQGVLDEPSFSNDRATGSPKRVFGNNKQYSPGDKIPIPNKSGSGTEKGKGSDELGEFEFVLSRQEFLDILFEDLVLPNYVKEALVTDVKYRLKRGGTSPDGPINRLNLLKTMLTAVGRKFATKATVEERHPGKKPAFITEEDLQFNVYTKRPIPIKKAVMFALMDASGSMGEEDRQLAKRFFILLYLFLDRQYEEVDIVFIAHHSEAQELTEKEFFSVESSGGTVVASAFALMKKIIDERYDVSKVNIYAAQASDGDLFESESEFLESINTVLPKLQYLAYMQTTDRETQTLAKHGFLRTRDDLYNFYKRNFEGDNRIGYSAAAWLEDVFEAFKKLFRRNKE